jgi:hypothetical protein
MVDTDTFLTDVTGRRVFLAVISIAVVTKLSMVYTNHVVTGVAGHQMLVTDHILANLTPVCMRLTDLSVIDSTGQKITSNMMCFAVLAVSRVLTAKCARTRSINAVGNADAAVTDNTWFKMLIASWVSTGDALPNMI